MTDKKPTAELIASVEELQGCLAEVDGCELNINNYNEDDVSKLNNAFVLMYGAMENAIKTMTAHKDRLAELEARADKLEMALELWQQMWPGMRDCVVNERAWYMKDAHKDNMDAAYKYGQEVLDHA